MRSSTEAAGRPPARLSTSLEAELARASVWASVVLLLFDLDEFGAVADHATGTADVRRLGDSIERALPGTTVLQYSRDGYAVVAALELAQAVLAAEAIRAEIARGRGCRVTVGVASLAGSGPHAVSLLLWSAQEALQQGKSAGGDRVVVGRATPMVLKSTYYPRAQLERLARLSDDEQRTEASLLREALEHLLGAYEQ